MKYVMMLTLSFVTFAISASAEDSVSPGIDASSQITVSLTANVRNPIANNRWYFLGCVDSEHECEDNAHQRGLHHHVVRHQDFRCHHDHHEDGCYGRN